MSAGADNTIADKLLCMTCCYDWEKVGENRWKNTKSEKVYGANSQDSPKELRIKFAGLIFLQPLLNTFLRMPYRVYTIFRGDWLEVGREKALKEWQVESQKWSLNPDKTIAPPEKSSFNVAKYSVCELAKSIAKLVTYPLATVAMELAFLYGFLSPNTGRAIYAAIEHAWASNKLDEITDKGGKVSELVIRMTSKCGNIFKFLKWKDLRLRIGDYASICMQPKEVWDKCNFYRRYPDYNPGTLRSLIRQLNTNLQEKQEFFEKEFEKGKVHFKDILDKCEKYKRNVTKLSGSDGNEMNAYYSANEQWQNAEKARTCLKNVIDNLRTLEVVRNQEFQEQASSWKISRDKTPKKQELIDQIRKDILKDISLLDDSFKI